MIGGHELDPLKLATAKLQSQPGQAALKLMDCLFTTKEMVNGNLSGATNSKELARQQGMRKLDHTRLQYIFGKYYFLSPSLYRSINPSRELIIL